MKGTSTSRNNSSPQGLAGKGKINPVNRLLIVDDDHGLVNLLKRFLEGENFRVDAAYDHATGLSAALSGEHELIILDVMLPGGTGFELLTSQPPRPRERFAASGLCPGQPQGMHTARAAGRSLCATRNIVSKPPFRITRRSTQCRG